MTSSNLRIQHTFLLLQAISVVLLVRPLFLQHLSVWQVRTSRTPSLPDSIATVTVKYTHKAALPGRSQSHFQECFTSHPSRMLQKSSSLRQLPSIPFATHSSTLNGYLHSCHHTFFPGRTLSLAQSALQRPTTENPSQRHAFHHLRKLLSPTHFPVNV